MFCMDVVFVPSKVSSTHFSGQINSVKMPVNQEIFNQFERRSNANDMQTCSSVTLLWTMHGLVGDFGVIISYSSMIFYHMSRYAMPPWTIIIITIIIIIIIIIIFSSSSPLFNHEIYITQVSQHQPSTTPNGLVSEFLD